MRRENIYDIHNKFFDLTSIFNWLGAYANDGGNVVGQRHQTLKAAADDKLLTLNVLGQHVSLLEI